MTELKPCPFCKQADKNFILFDSYIQEEVYRCPSCDYALTIIEYNTRPIEDALQQRIDVLETEIRRIGMFLDEQGLKASYEYKVTV